MPEQATSTVKFMVVVSGLVMSIVGVPYSPVSVAGIPKSRVRVVEASLL